MKTIPETKMIMFRSKTRKGYKFNEIFIGEYVSKNDLNDHIGKGITWV